MRRPVIGPIPWGPVPSNPGIFVHLCCDILLICAKYHKGIDRTWPDVGIELTIEDAGEAIFSRFEQGKARGSGQGLGLSICRMLLARYGGRIRVEDRVAGSPEEGVAFRFTLREARGGESGRAEPIITRSRDGQVPRPCRPTDRQ
jgi:Signal transduction histidine kinase